MSDRAVKGLIVFAAIMLLSAGMILFYIFDKQGMGKNQNNGYIDYNVDDYVEIIPINFDDYSDVYSSVEVSKVNIKNLDNELIQEFVDKESEIIGYITGYYNEIKSRSFFHNTNKVTSIIKTQINGTILSIFYRIDFYLDNDIFVDSNMNYIITYNIDLMTNKILTNDDLLSKYNYSKNYIGEKLFIEDILIGNDQVVIDKYTNISLTQKDIERRKDYYVERIIQEFDSIVVMYIDSGSLVLSYDKNKLKEIFFDGDFNTQIQERYLK